MLHHFRGDKQDVLLYADLQPKWIVAKARRTLVYEHPNFAGAVILTRRPR
jgi:hypothetical protein